MKNMTLAHITEVCGGIYFGSEEKKTAEVTDIVTDSRKAGEGSLFVAIPGERVDGHKFIPNVASQGALAVISEQKLETPPCPYILVKDSMEAIKAMAEYYMQQLNIPVVGITTAGQAAWTFSVRASTVAASKLTLVMVVNSPCISKRACSGAGARPASTSCPA